MPVAKRLKAVCSHVLYGCQLLPVSYTHLDVYKRQALYPPMTVAVSKPRFPRYLASFMLLPPVSYTHLDVYKRQINISSVNNDNRKTEKRQDVFIYLNPVSYTHLVYLSILPLVSRT